MWIDYKCCDHMNVFELICILKYVFYKCCNWAYEWLQVLGPLCYALTLQKPCFVHVLCRGRPAHEPGWLPHDREEALVSKAAPKCISVVQMLPLCTKHTKCFLDNVLTCYAWINHLNDLQMLYLIKWLYDLLIYMICNSCILCVNMLVIHARLIYGLSIHLEFVIMIKFIITIM